MTAATTNWARNVTYRATAAATPAGRDELAAVLRGSDRAKVRGSGHSFNRIADTVGTLISLDAMPGEVVVDRAAGTASVPGWWRYGDIVEQLDREGVALANLASLPHISVAGAIATGTHGSGDRVGPLSAAVRAVEIMTADGEVVVLRRGDADFLGAVVSLGALGVVLRVELDVVDRFEVAQTVFEDVPLADVLDDLDAVTALGYSTSLFTTWRRPELLDRVWVKRRVDDPTPLPGVLHGSSPAAGPRHPLPGVSAEACTPQLGVAGPWYDRLPHFRLAFTPSLGDELQSEFFVPRTAAVDAVRALAGLAARIAPLLLVNEVRTMAGEDQWLGPTGGRDTVGLHFTWVQDQPAVEALLPAIEAALAPFGARAHWGKLFTPSAERVRALYPRLGDFLALRARCDPRGVFANPYLAALGVVDQD